MGWLVFDRKRCHISKRQCYISPIEPPLQARFANRGWIEDGAARRHPMAPARAARYNGKRTTMAQPLNISPDRLRSEERRVGKEGVSKCRTRGSQYNKKKMRREI